jgi:hypothetical protein
MGSKHIRVEYGGETLKLNAWATRLGIPQTTLSRRLLNGWDVTTAFETPASGPGKYERAPAVERFWEGVRKLPGEDACWLWTRGKRGSNGYGNFKVDGKSTGTHIFSFELHNGRKPNGLVMHTCNEPACVRPEHLVEGTCKQNLEYAASLGRMAHGSRNGSAKLDEQQARDIFVRYEAGGTSQQSLADEYKVSQPVVSEIVRGLKWKRATGAATKKA